MRRRLPWLLLVLAAACGQLSGRITETSAATYVRTDDDRTTVVSPRVHVAGKVEDALSLETTYTMDAWTGASIDVRTAATQAIHETRHEINAGAGYELSDVTVSGSYRYSTEDDYTSHGGVVGTALDFAGNDANVALQAFGSLDSVGRAGDPSFDESQTSLGGRATLTQALSSETTAQMAWETLRIAGFQSSVYRFVAIGGDGTCASEAPFCIPEHVPDERFRHAATVRARHALSDHVSAGVEYRAYVDSWGLSSQTLQPDLALRLTERGTLTLRYRYYTQGEADFYRPRYFDLESTGGFATRDRKLSASYAHLFGASYLYELPFDGDADTVLVLGARGAVTRITYQAFVGLENVTALELTTLLGLEFR